MKNLVMLVALAVIGACIWTYHSDKVKEETARAKAAAVAESQAELKKTRDDLRKKYNAELEKTRIPVVQPPPVQPAPMQAVAISRMLEHWYFELFSDLNQATPADLVPPLTIARERLLDSKALVEPAKRPIYDAGVNVLSRMILVAEERTKALETLLSTEADPRTALDSKHTAVASRTFFASSATRKWDVTRKQAKPAIDQVFAQLRAGERAWNQKAGPDAAVDSYDLGSLTPVMIAPSGAQTSNSLGKGAYGESRPWRRPYYIRYNGPR
jgi:hypothetical protein